MEVILLIVANPFVARHTQVLIALFTVNSWAQRGHVLAFLFLWTINPAAHKLINLAASFAKIRSMTSIRQPGPTYATAKTTTVFVINATRKSSKLMI
jgi:hypothetical protein